MSGWMGQAKDVEDHEMEIVGREEGSKLGGCKLQAAGSRVCKSQGVGRRKRHLGRGGGAEQDRASFLSLRFS
jgi:hypothetical protein